MIEILLKSLLKSLPFKIQQHLLGQPLLTVKMLIHSNAEHSHSSATTFPIATDCDAMLIPAKYGAF
jgi:hypothetical protein